MLGIGIIVVLWKLLLPGYVLTLDMAPGRQVPFPRIGLGGYWNAALFRWPMYVLGLVVPSWVVQKLTFLGLFITLPLCGFRSILPSSSTRTRIWIALFYTINPFVYTRFLAGQWTILVAYSFLPLVWHFATKLKEGEKRSAIFLGLALLGTFAFSLHIGVIALFVWAFALLGWMSIRSVRAWAMNVLAGAVLVVGSLYWLIPAFVRKGSSLLEIIDVRHIEAFRTTTDPLLGTIGNVLALGGFWGEREIWANRFIWPMRTQPVLWGIAGGVLAALIVWGIVSTLRKQELRRQGTALLALGACALVFSCGVGDSIFSSINEWLFTHVGFWNGFRDSQKWSGVLVLVYAYFGGRGIDALRDAPRRQLIVTVAGILATLTFTYPMLFGFWGQLKPVWYPDSWYQANEVLKRDKDCKALFLPWHAYFTLKFNRDLLTASPARDFFDCELVMSRQIEIGGIGQQGPLDPAYDAIEGVVTGKDGWNPEQSLALLRQSGIRYVIFAHDIKEQDQWRYDFLNQPSLKLYTWDGLTLYQLTN